jgi:hypothetical protein
VCDLAPEAVIRGDLDLLQALLDRFPAYAVDGWHVRGKVSHDLTINTNSMQLANNIS